MARTLVVAALLVAELGVTQLASGVTSGARMTPNPP